MPSETDASLHLLVVIGSTRPGRVGKPVADWFAATAQEHGDFTVEVADLADVALPLLDEAAHPRLAQYEHEHTLRWSETVARADAVVFVMPEYNHSFNAALKNGIDYLNREWAYKPVGTVSYGGVSGGMRAVRALQPVLLAVRMIPVGDAVLIPMVRTMLDDAGVFTPNDVVAASAKPMLDELAAVARATSALRPAG